jgi:rubrerythrin
LNPPTLYLQLKANNKSYTLQRHKSGGDFRLYECIYEDITEGSTFRELCAAHDENDDENISSFFLGLSNLKHKKLLKSKEDKDTQNLSFRTLSKLVTVSEERIITKDSVINASGQRTDKTVYSTLFRLLLTGEDYTGFISKKKVQLTKNTLEGSITSLKELIQSLKEKIKGIKSTSLSDKKVEKLNEEITSAIDATVQVEAQVSEIEEKRYEAWSQIYDNKNSLSTASGLESRFSLLRAHYESDLKRLAAIQETGHFFAKISVDKCPVCGAPPEKHDCTHIDSDGDLQSLNVACTKEIEKIIRLLKDLDSTVNKLAADKEKMQQRIDKNKKLYSQLQSDIAERLKPRHREMKNKLDQLVNSRDELNRLAVYEEQLASLEEMKKIKGGELERCLNGPVDQELPSVELETKDVAGFLVKYRELLVAWKFPSLDSVLFSESNIDFVISGKNRSSFGKGYRAILYAGFCIALLEYCIDKNIPHPGFVVLDSPLTTYKEAKSKQETPNEEIPTDMKETFFDYLANNAKGQIIILDNAEPSLAVQEKIKCYNFTGIKGEDRFGFFSV